MIHPSLNRCRPGPLLLALALALAAAGCDTYYIPPPPVSITLTNSSANPDLEISQLNSFGQLVPNTLPLTATVSNASNTNVTFYVGQLGQYVQGGDSTLGYVDNNGVYTAPLVVPTPNEVTVKAVPVADTSQSATTTLILENVDAAISGASPSVVTAGRTYSFDVTGQYFAPGATVQLSGAQVNNASVQYISSTEYKFSASVQSAGLLSLQILNPYEYGQTNAAAIRSFPAAPPASSSLAVLVADAGHDSNGNIVTATKAYAVESGSLAVVNLDANHQFGSVVLPSGFTPTMVAADPAHTQIVVASYSSNILQVVDANQDAVVASYSVPVSTTTTVDGATCKICGLMVDSTRELAILDTAAGYFTLDLATGATSTPLAAPAAANFAYNPATQRIYAPYVNSSGAGANVIDLVSDTVTALEPGDGVLLGAGSDVADLDPATAILDVGDLSGGSYVSLNLNNAAVSNGTVVAPAAPFTLTTGCNGAWNQMDQDFTTHLGWFANQGECVAVATLPLAPPSGVPASPTAIRWARVPLGPDGLAWANVAAGSPQGLAVYVGPDGRIYGLALRNDDAVLLKMDLEYLQQATAVAGGADVNQVDPTNVTVNGQTVSAMTFIPLHQ